MLRNLVKFSKFAFSKVHTPICIVGGGCGGVSIASQLIKSKKVSPEDVRVFEPKSEHFY